MTQSHFLNRSYLSPRCSYWLVNFLFWTLLSNLFVPNTLDLDESPLKPSEEVLVLRVLETCLSLLTGKNRYSSLLSEVDLVLLKSKVDTFSKGERRRHFTPYVVPRFKYLKREEGQKVFLVVLCHLGKILTLRPPVRIKGWYLIQHKSETT